MYRANDLPTTTIYELPKDAGAKIAWQTSMGALFNFLDYSPDDKLIRWLRPCYNPVGSARKVIHALHTDSWGLVRLDTCLAKQLLNPTNLAGQFGQNFMHYAQWCQNQGVGPRGRVLLGFVGLKFRLQKERVNIITQQHLHQIALESFSTPDVVKFCGKVRTCLQHIEESDMPQSKFMFQWLFAKFKNWKPIAHKIRRIRESRLTSKTRSWSYLWNAHSCIRQRFRRG